MRIMLANSIWMPLFIYCYDWRYVLVSTIAGFAAELWMFQRHMRGIIAPDVARKRLIKANLISWIAGFPLILFVPFKVPMEDMWRTVGAFAAGWMITVIVEALVLRRSAPGPAGRLIYAIVMMNTASYAILFFGFLLWMFGWRVLVPRW